MPIKPKALSVLVAGVLLLTGTAAALGRKRQAQADAGSNGASPRSAVSKTATPRSRAGDARGANSARAARYFDSVRNDPPLLLAFIKAMPKGADLHNHLSGAVYAEDYIKLAIANQLCVNQDDRALALPPCQGGQKIDEAIRTNSTLYDKLIDAWSMRNWQLSGESGHDHFFATFGKFGAAIADHTFPDMLAAALTQAASDHLTYVELMFTPNSSGVRKVAQGRWNTDLGVMSKSLIDAGLDAEVKAGLDLAKQITTDARKRMGCGTSDAGPGCSVETRFLFQGQRGSPRELAFALFLAGFQMATHPDNRDPQTGEPLLVGINLVQPEDSLIALADFRLQMSMLDYLHQRYPAVHIALHAGELAPGLVPAPDLAFHIRESVERGHAERIGHGVDVMSEDRPSELLEELASRGVAVEICLSSNELILGVSGPRHPLSAYIKYNVPVMLATDDEGVARSSMTNEYVKAVKEQGLAYEQLKTMARTSLEYSFAGGRSLWKDPKHFVPLDQCRDSTATALSKECASFLKSNKKADMQFRLERDFDEFESRIAREPM